MNPNALRFIYGLVTGVGLFAAITGDWRVVLCAALALIMFRLATQGGEK